MYFRSTCLSSCPLYKQSVPRYHTQKKIIISFLLDRFIVQEKVFETSSLFKVSLPIPLAFTYFYQIINFVKRELSYIPFSGHSQVWAVDIVEKKEIKINSCTGLPKKD